MDQELQIQSLAAGPVRANCYILSRKGREDCVLIDPGGEPEKILAAAGGKKVAAVLLTHGHFDHIGGVPGVVGPDAKVYIHPLDAPMLNDPRKNMAVLMGKALSVQVAAEPACEGDTIAAAGMAFFVLHTPGHTPGSVCYRAGGTLFTGDTMFHGGYGRTDLPGGSWSDLYNSMKRLLAMQKDVKVYPGHEDVTTIGLEQGSL